MYKEKKRGQIKQPNTIYRRCEERLNGNNSVEKEEIQLVVGINWEENSKRVRRARAAEKFSTSAIMNIKTYDQYLISLMVLIRLKVKLFFAV